MKKTIVLFLCLALISLACLQTIPISESLAPVTSPTFVKVEENPAGAVFESVEIMRVPFSEVCAVVIAIEALHLRKGPSEDGIVLTWLKNGDVVNVLDQAHDDWWRIERAGVSGYVRSIYLEIGDCDAKK